VTFSESSPVVPAVPGRAGLSGRWWVPVVGYGLALGLAMIALQEALLQSQTPWAAEFAWGNGDLNGYLEGTRHFLSTGTPYTTDQLSGQWALGTHSFIHPPIALLLFLPFLILPWALFWLIPIAGTIWLVARSRPGPWRLCLMAALLIWPHSIGAIEAGNTDLWATFAMALGMRYGWPLVLLAIKPTFGFLALIGVRDRSLWIAAAITGGLSLLFLPLWFQWIDVVRGAGIAPSYSLLGLPLILIPVVAGRR
jgi:hypothetical protein